MMEKLQVFLNYIPATQVQTQFQTQLSCSQAYFLHQLMILHQIALNMNQITSAQQLFGNVISL